MNKVKNFEKKRTELLIVQPKLDGYRCITEIDSNNKVDLLSRNGIIYRNFPKIYTAIRELNLQNMVLDGEIMSDDFQSMQRSAFAEKRATTVGDVKYYVFDLLTAQEWSDRKCSRSFLPRYDNLCSLLKDKHPDIIVVESIICRNMKEVTRAYERFLEEGYEGAIIRNNVPYEWKRTDNLMKLKPNLDPLSPKTMDCIIVGTTEGRYKYEGKLGALVVQQENNKICEVGTGFTDAMREEDWESCVGDIVEIKYQELTPDGIMRFPSFLRFRDDKKFEERINEETPAMRCNGEYL